MKRAWEYSSGSFDLCCSKGLLEFLVCPTARIAAGLFPLPLGLDAGLFIVFVAADLAFQARLFTTTLETPQNLIDRFICADHNLNPGHPQPPFLNPFIPEWAFLNICLRVNLAHLGSGVNKYDVTCLN